MHASRRRVPRPLASLVAAAVAATVVVGIASPASAAAGVAVSQTVGLDRAGQTVTVTGDGFDATGNLGTRPPLAGKPAGVYVIFGKFDTTWQPSTGAPSSSRRVIDQVWALPEPSHSQLDPDGTNPEIVLMNPDGSFTADLDATIDTRPGNYGIYTYPGSGAVSAAHETATPVSFAIAEPGAPAIGDVTAHQGAATVTWTAPADDGGSPVTGYVVTPQVAGAAVTAAAPVTAPADATSILVDGLDDGTAHTFTVAATNALGTGPASAESPAVTPQWWLPWSSGEAAVTEVFTSFTGSAPTAGERSSWTAQLDAGTAHLGDLVAALRDGDDATANVDPATRLYSAYFVRVPDKGGLEFWVKRRRTGDWTLFRTSSHFAASSEFTSTYGNLTNQAFVELVYQNVLGRDADPGGLAFWKGRLDSGRIGRGQVMINFSESSEYRRIEEHRVDAAIVYISLLDRSPSAAERDQLATALEGGADLGEAVRALLRQPS